MKADAYIFEDKFFLQRKIGKEIIKVLGEIKTQVSTMDKRIKKIQIDQEVMSHTIQNLAKKNEPVDKLNQHNPQDLDRLYFHRGCV